jgi:hypothetical protein
MASANFVLAVLGHRDDPQVEKQVRFSHEYAQAYSPKPLDTLRIIEEAAINNQRRAGGVTQAGPATTRLPTFSGQNHDHKASVPTILRISAME